MRPNREEVTGQILGDCDCFLFFKNNTGNISFSLCCLGGSLVPVASFSRRTYPTVADRLQSTNLTFHVNYFQLEVHL